MFEKSAGESTYRAYQVAPGQIAFERKFENAPGAQFDFVEHTEVPPDLITQAQVHFGVSPADPTPPRDKEDDMA